MKTLVSVIIPTFNRAIELKRAINSVLNQTYQNFEILVCDDGSTDNSEQVILDFNDERIFWIPGINSGRPAVPRNKGIFLSKGEYLAFLDSDDYWEPQKLERQILILNNFKVKAVCTNAKILVSGVILSSNYFNFSHDKILKIDDMLIVNEVICSSMVIHKSLIQFSECFPESVDFKSVEDYIFWLNLALFTDIYFLSDPLTVYRDEPTDSVRGTVKFNEQKLKRAIFRYLFDRVHKMKSNKISLYIKILFFRLNLEFNFIRKIFFFFKAKLRFN